MGHGDAVGAQSHGIASEEYGDGNDGDGVAKQHSITDSLFGGFPSTYVKSWHLRGHVGKGEGGAHGIAGRGTVGSWAEVAAMVAGRCVVIVAGNRQRVGDILDEPPRRRATRGADIRRTHLPFDLGRAEQLHIIGRDVAITADGDALAADGACTNEQQQTENCHDSYH